MTQPALRRSLLLSLLDLSGETALRLQRELLLRWTQQALQLTQKSLLRGESVS